MKTIFTLLIMAAAFATFGYRPASAQDTATPSTQQTDAGETVVLRKFLIERTIPGLGDMSPEQLSQITAASNAVLDGMKATYHWVQSFVTGDKMYCIHIAPDEETVREHARRGGFPADRVVEITGTIDPTTTRLAGQ